MLRRRCRAVSAIDTLLATPPRRHCLLPLDDYASDTLEMSLAVITDE